MEENKEKINDNNDLINRISVIMFLYNDTIKISKIKEFLNDETLELTKVKETIELLNNKLEKIGLTIVENVLNNNDIEYQIVVSKSYVDIAKKIKEDDLSGELTPASLQVLTICAYLGASTKNEISFIRGVQSSQSIRSLSTRGLIKKVGDKYIITIEALQKLGIYKINDLPEYEKISNDFKERLKEILIREKEDN